MAVLDSDDKGRHEFVIILHEPGNDDATDAKEGYEKEVSNSANKELSNDVAGTPEVHKNSGGDSIIKNSKHKSKRKKVIESVSWKKSNLTELRNKQPSTVSFEPIDIFNLIFIQKYVNQNQLSENLKDAAKCNHPLTLPPCEIDSATRTFLLTNNKNRSR